MTMLPVMTLTAALALAPGCPRTAWAAYPTAPLSTVESAMAHEDGQTREESLYEEARDAIDDEQWSQAIRDFDRVIALKGARADAAMYWKAYAQHRANQRAEALTTLAQLAKAYPQSRTLEQARALELEVRGATGQPVNPASVADEDLKVYALQSLAYQEPAQAVPLLEKLIAGNASPKLKERALFVLAQISDARARQVLARAARDDAHPDLQAKAIQYLGVHGSSEDRALLAEVYQGAGSVRVKKRVLQAWMVSGQKDRILAAATGETDADLRGEAIQLLGAMGALDELSRLYAQESSKPMKKRVLQAMFIGGRADRLIELAKTEPDAELRATAIRNLGLMRTSATGATLVELYGSERDPAVRKAVVEGLFLQGNAEALVALARKESDPEMKRSLVERLSLMSRSKVAMDYLMEILK